MYRELFEKYQAELPKFPKHRRPLLGSVIKETRIDKGIRQIDFAKLAGINESALKSIENDHQQATTVENLEAIGKHLGMDIETMILRGRERDPANFFVFKKSAPAAVKGIRKRKRFSEEWFESIRIRFKDFDFMPISPPMACQRDFFIGRLVIPPKRSLAKLTLGNSHPVIAFVSTGFNILVRYGNKSAPLTAQQGFSILGNVPHTISNEDEDHAAVIYLLAKLPSSKQHNTSRSFKQEAAHSELDIARGIEELRRQCSDRPGRSLAIKHLADLTDTLNHEQIIKLTRLKRGSSVIYWEKIEDLLAGTGVSMEVFLAWSRRKEKESFRIAGAVTRVMLNASAYGVKLFSAVPPAMKNEYFLGEMTIEAGKGISGRSWERKDNAMIAIFIEEGEIEIAVGKSRNPIPILKGESVYFDGSLGYVLRNPGQDQARGFFASHPGIQF